jgi:hypothetical protein
MPTTHYVQDSIDGLLKLSDKMLSKMFNMDADEIRRDLREQKAKGHVYVGSDKCEGFDPVKGCPGHEDNEHNKQIHPSPKE